MSFDAHEEKIRKIFSGDSRFTIPRNQRKYVWDEKQWMELYDDVVYTYTKKKEMESGKEEISHFLGSFVLQEKDKKYDIIDGQQRITTLFLMLSSLCAAFNKIDDEEEHGITKQYLIGNIGLKSEYVRMQNSIIENIEKIIVYSCEYKEKVPEKDIFSESLLKTSDASNKKIISCFDFYYNKWLEHFWLSKELSAIRESILDMKVIHITSEDELDCYDIFEILNARGVDLEESELLKNFIFKYAQPKYSIDNAKEIWGEIEKNMHLCKNSMELFLTNFISYKFVVMNKADSVFRTIKSNTPKNEVKELLDEILAASEKYVWFFSSSEKIPKEVNECFEFFKLINHRQFRPLFLAILDAYFNSKTITEKELCDICVYLKNFSFGFTFVMHTNSNLIEKKIIELSNNVYKLKNKESLAEIKSKLNRYYPSYNEFERYFLNIGYSNKNKLFSNSNNKKRMFYLLKSIETYKNNSSELECKWEKCNIEHIMNDSETDNNTSYVGNLLLISEKINSKMGNSDFKEKIPLLKESQLESVKEFVKFYGSESEWTIENITKRGQNIAKLAYEKVWKL